VATRVITVDDFDGHEGEDVTKRDFQLGETTYTIDLGDENFKKLQEAIEVLTPYLEKANRVKQAGRARRTTSDTVPRLRGYSNSDVREWARQEGIEVSSRGKIGDDVYEKFIAAHPDANPDD